MKVHNEHRRRLPASASATLSFLLDRLATPRDGLWPHEVWPRMRLDGRLGVGARGGRGPIRYIVSRHEPGAVVEFRFLAPEGFDGTHRFEVVAAGEDVELRHALQMELRGMAVFTWPLVFRPLHDALLEDAMAKAQRAAGVRPRLVRWSAWVRLLRRLLARRPRPQRDLLATEISHR